MGTYSITPKSVDLRVSSYENFQGIDASRDERSMETNRDQHLVGCHNCHCDWRGNIVRDASALKVNGDYPVTHVTLASELDPIWAQQTGQGIDLRNIDGATIENAYTTGSAITSIVFGQKTLFASRGQNVYEYADGSFSQNLGPSLNLLLKPAYMASVQRRLAVAGINGQNTVVHISRVDNADVMPDDEQPDEESVLRAGTIDIGNLLGTADKITGLRTFERNKLCIFTQDQCIIYEIDPDIDEWKIDKTSNINIGCVSHNTITAAGNDILFCSRSGIHSIRRSQDNGILATSKTLSEKVEDIYKSLLRQVEKPELISAVFDQDRGQYHVYFPRPNNGGSTRLTITLNPEQGDQAEPKHSTSDFLNASCGAFLGGKFVIGTPGGIYNVLRDNEENPDAVTPIAKVTFPFFWHGDLVGTKHTHSLIIQANGKGTVTLKATDYDGKSIGSIVTEADANSDDSSFLGVALSEQYEKPFAHKYRAAQYTLEVSGGTGVFRIVGLAVLIKKKP